MPTAAAAAADSHSTQRHLAIHCEAKPFTLTSEFIGQL